MKLACLSPCLALLVISCDAISPTYRNWERCDPSEGLLCKPGFTCVANDCVAVGALPDAGGLDGNADGSGEGRDGSSDRGATDAGQPDTRPAMPDAMGSCGRPADCPGSQPFCIGNRCVGCQEAGPQACSGATPVCGPSGGCVECTADAQCASAERPICVTGKCVGCGMAPAQACATKNPMAAVCGSSGACVECTTDAQCSDPKRPICESSKCRACGADAECSKKLGPTGNPGVCMSHQDGRCATDAETIYVQRGTGTGCATAFGTAQMPLCSAQDATRLLSQSRRLVVVSGTIPGFSWTISSSLGQVTVVGKPAAGQPVATISGGADPGIYIAGADFFGRDFKVSPSSNVGIIAEMGAVLRLHNITVEANQKGGILLKGAGGLEITNARVTGNGPGELPGGLSWGGIRVEDLLVGATARLERVSVLENKQVGLSCARPITGSGVLAASNVGGIDISTSCGVTSCGAAGPMCGAP